MTGMTGKTGVTKMTGMTRMTGMTGMTGRTGVTKMTGKTRITGMERITGMIRMTGMTGMLVFKPKYWADLFNYILFVLFFCLLLHCLAVRISLPFHIFLQVVIVLIQVYNWEIQHHSLVCRCGLADILYMTGMTKMTGMTRMTRMTKITGMTWMTRMTGRQG